MRLWFGMLLLAYPAVFRRRFGDEIRGQAVEECTAAFEGGWWRGWGCLAATAVDLVGSGVAERWAPTWIGDPGENADFETGVGMMIGQWIQDVRYAVRSLRRAPGFTAAAVGTLALALGANAAIFSLVDGVLLRPLPYAQADRLVHISASAPGSDLPDRFGASIEFYAQYRDEATQLESVASFNSFTATVRADERVERLRVSMPSLSLFSTLGAEPILGRLPRPEEAGQVALLSHGLWTTWFGNDPAVIGRSMFVVNGEKTIVGVMGDNFRFPLDDIVAWVPNPEVTAAEITNVGRFGIQLVGRLADGADEASLVQELTVLARRLPELYGGSPEYARIIEQHVPVVTPVAEMLFGPVSTALWVLMGAVGVVLLIACANVANLFTVRAEGRGRAMAVRQAIGAGRGALVRAAMAEAIVVAAAAGLLAIGLAAVLLPLYLAVIPDGVPRIADVHLSPLTLLFTGVAAAATALICGLGPALRSSRADLGRLRDGSRGSTSRRHWGRNALVVSQTALALVLLVGSGLMLRSVQQLRAVDTGFDTSGILTFQFAPELEHLIDGPSWARFHEDMMARLAALPGVETVGIVENVPLEEGTLGVGFVAEAAGSDLSTDAGVQGNFTFAGGDYFAAMGIDVIAGRPFRAGEATVPGQVVVSKSLADQLWPGLDPLGKRLRNSQLESWHEVIAVVDDVVQNDLRDIKRPTAYYPLWGEAPGAYWLTSPGYVVRSTRADGLVPEVRALVREVAPGAPVYRIFTMSSLIERSTRSLSFTMLTMAVAAGLALVLGAVGLYGVLSYVVSQRTREIGVRMALGAEAGRVRRMVVVEGVRVVAVGIVLGLGVAAVASRALSSMLFGVPSMDPLTFGGMALAMALVGWLASWVPARRAARVDPIHSMRGD